MASTQLFRQRINRKRALAEADFSKFEQATDIVDASKMLRAEELMKEQDVMKKAWLFYPSTHFAATSSTSFA